jgi:predicted HTH transcriptional regulator
MMRIFKDLDLVEHLGSGIPRYWRQGFYFQLEPKYFKAHASESNFPRNKVPNISSINQIPVKIP